MDVFFIWEHREKSLKNVLRLYHKMLNISHPNRCRRVVKRD